VLVRVDVSRIGELLVDAARRGIASFLLARVGMDLEHDANVLQLREASILNVVYYLVLLLDGVEQVGNRESWKEVGEKVEELRSYAG
jgi:hypothetical protein